MEKTALTAKNFPAIIKQIRKENSWTTQDLAIMLDVSKRTVEGWEHGREPSKFTIPLLQVVVGCGNTTAKKYTMIDDCGGEVVIIAGDDSEAAEKMKRIMEACENFDESNSTIWYSAELRNDEGEIIDGIQIEKHPEEPPCTKSEHDWQTPHEIVGGSEVNPGYHGNHKYTEVCAHCGVYKDEDQDAMDPDTGERGLTSISYREADDVSLEWCADN